MSGQVFIYPPSKVTIPTGDLATSANQATEIALLQQIEARIAGSLVPEEYDQVTLTYIAAGNGTGEVGVVVYKLATATIKTLTLTYDASNRLIDVIAS